MKRTTRTLTILALTLGLAACQDLGLAGNIPLEEAVDRPPSELVAAVYAPTEVAQRPLVVDGRGWAPSGAPLTVSQQELRAVGSTGGRTVFALSWDQPPYDRLYTPLEAEAPTDSLVFGPQEGEQWQEWAPILGLSNVGAAGAGADYMEEGPGAVEATAADDATDTTGLPLTPPAPGPGHPQ